MIVLIGEDETCVSMMKCMSIQNPEDTVVRFNPKTYRFLTEAGKELLEFEKPLKRISFVDHGSTEEFAGLDVKKFTNVLQRELRAAAQIDPSVQKSLKNIDIVACEIGSVIENESCYAHHLASSCLEELGNEFNFEIKAFTNIMTPHTAKLTTTTVGTDITDEGLMEISCFKDFDSFATYQDHLIRAEFMLDNINEKTEIIFNLEANLVKDPNNQNIKKQLNSLNSSLKILQDSAKQLAEKIKSFKTIALVTDNVRHSLDTNLKCNFTYQVKIEKLNNELAKLQENKNENDKKIADLGIQKDKLTNQYNELLSEGKKLTKHKEILEEQIEILENKIDSIKEKFDTVRERINELKTAYQADNISEKQQTSIKVSAEKLLLSRDTLKKQGTELVEEKTKVETQLTNIEERFQKLTETITDIKKISAPGLNQQELKLIEEGKKIKSEIQNIEKAISSLQLQEKKTKTPLQAAGMYQSTAKQPSEERKLPTPTRQRR